MAAERKQLVIIGAGLSGLCLAKTYLQCAPATDLLVIDANASIGGTWCRERLYPSLRSNNLRGTFEFPDFPFHDGYGVKHDEYTPGHVMNQYLSDFADHFGVTKHVRLLTKAIKATRVTDGTPVKWLLEVATLDRSDGSAKISVIECEKLAVSTGLTSQPIPFVAPGVDDFDAPIQPFSTVAPKMDRVGAQEGQGNITVLGGGKSAYDAAYILAMSGYQVNWVIRKSGYGPTFMAPSYVDIGPIKHNWLEALVTTRFLTWFSPNIWDKGGNFPLVPWLLHNTAPGRAFVRTFWHHLDQDTLEQTGINRDPSLKPLRPDQSAQWYATSVAILNYPTDFHELVINGRVKVYREDISHLTKHAIHLGNGDVLPSERGLITTGWHHMPNLQFEPASIRSDLGIPGSGYSAEQRTFWSDLDAKADKEIYKQLPGLLDAPMPPRKRLPETALKPGEEQQYRLYRFLAPPMLAAQGDRSIVFFGLFAFLQGFSMREIAAVWTYAYMNGQLEAALPSGPAEIPYQSALHARFVNIRFPWGFGSMFPDFVFEGVAFLDMLLKDLGLPSRRKKGLWSELTSPYGVADYRGIAAEWLAKQQQQQQAAA